jgi:hypothetical protein
LRELLLREKPPFALKLWLLTEPSLLGMHPNILFLFLLRYGKGQQSLIERTLAAIARR